jgi:energy-coupling factor transport system ATP-binding protein
MIRFESAGVAYETNDGVHQVLSGVDLRIEEGELALVVGPTGSGKTTLLGCVNGLVPHFTGGTLSGRVLVEGRDTRTHRPRDLADVVGMVGQDPLASFVTDTVEEEIAYGMESIGLSSAVMRRRVEETLDVLGLADVRNRTLTTLSGGQQQRVAIGGVLAAQPRILVLDEPTSALDPVAAEDVLAALTRLVHDLGLTVLMAEHRLERVVQYADRLVVVDGGTVVHGPVADQVKTSPVVPPVVDLGRLAGWSPLPLSVRDARRMARPLVARLSSATPRRSRIPLVEKAEAAVAPVTLGLARGLQVHRGGVPVLRGVDAAVHAGEVVALMGRNGAGKSTLLGALAGQLIRRGGTLRVGGGKGPSAVDPAETPPRELVRRVGMVPQDAGLLLYSDTVEGECAGADHDFDAPAGTCRRLLDRLIPTTADGLAIDSGAHPRDLSEGQRLALALAVILTGSPSLLLLDEPTRGLDYRAKERLVVVLRELAAHGHGVLLATHDVELAAECADRVMVMAEGEIVSDGPAEAVLAGSRAFAPQVAKVLHPLAWLTVADVAAALDPAS